MHVIVLWALLAFQSVNIVLHRVPSLNFVDYDCKLATHIHCVCSGAQF